MIVRLLFGVALFLSVSAHCFAQQSTADIDQRFTAELLKTTLFARTAEEKRFCDYVIQRRDAGTLPTRLIYGAYQMAMTKDRARRFAYFKAALELLCRREGIVLNPNRSPTPPRQTQNAWRSFNPWR